MPLTTLERSETLTDFFRNGFPRDLVWTYPEVVRYDPVDNKNAQERYQSPSELGDMAV